MDLSRLTISDSEDRLDSLTLSLEAVIRWAGGNVRYRSLNAALGMSFMTAAVRGQSCLAWWMTHGCDAFLIEAARMFGVRVRALHPPESSVGLSSYAEFAQHFEASYAPLIRRALENGQPVLAWQGWSDFHESLWGVITGESSQGVGFLGITMWSGGERISLVKPSVQMYVVEEVAPCEPSNEELMLAGIRRANAFMHDAAVEDPAVVTGVKGYDAWIERLGEEAVCPTCGGRSNHCHLQHARFITSNRRSAIRFLNHYRDGVSAELHESIDSLTGLCQATVDALAVSRDETSVDRLIRTHEGRRDLTAGVRRAAALEVSTAEAIGQLAERLTISS